MTNLTEEEFLRSKMTRWDDVCWYSWTVPFVAVVFAIFCGLVLEEPRPVVVVCVGAFVLTFPVMVILRTVLGNKILARKDEYQRLLRR